MSSETLVALGFYLAPLVGLLLSAAWFFIGIIVHWNKPDSPIALWAWLFWIPGVIGLLMMLGALTVAIVEVTS